MPGQYYAQFAQWHQLAMLKSPKVLAELRRLAQAAVTPTAIEDFITVVEMDLGFGLYRAVSDAKTALRSEEHTSELQSLMRISYAVFCLKKKKTTNITTPNHVRMSKNTQP